MCEIVKLQQNLNFITRILKQIVRSQYSFREDFILYIKGKQKKKIFQVFGDTTILLYILRWTSELIS